MAPMSLHHWLCCELKLKYIPRPTSKWERMSATRSTGGLQRVDETCCFCQVGLPWWLSPEFTKHQGPSNHGAMSLELMISSGFHMELGDGQLQRRSCRHEDCCTIFSKVFGANQQKPGWKLLGEACPDGRKVHIFQEYCIPVCHVCGLVYHRNF